MTPLRRLLYDLGELPGSRAYSLLLEVGIMKEGDQIGNGGQYIKDIYRYTVERLTDVPVDEVEAETNSFPTYHKLRGLIDEWKDEPEERPKPSGRIEHFSRHGTRFTSETADLSQGVHAHLASTHTPHHLADAAEFGAWHAMEIRPLLKGGFRGYDAVRYLFTYDE